MRLGAPVERPPMDSTRTEYEFAVLRVVPHVHLGAFVNVGVVLHARRAGLLTLRAIDDPARLRALLAGAALDVDLLARYLRALALVGAGDPSGGAIALVPTSERFHWLTAPRSDVLQSSPVHEGVCDDPAAEVEALFAAYVAGPAAATPSAPR